MKFFVGWFFTDFSPRGFEGLAEELSLMDDVRIEFLHFNPSLMHYFWTFSDWFVLPRNSVECDSEYANHVVFWMGDKKFLEFWRYLRINKKGILHENLDKEYIKKTESILFRRNWFNHRKFIGLVVLSFIVGLIPVALKIISFPSLTLILILLWTISYWLINILNRVRG